MVLNEAKLRVVIREELTQYLIEQGFFQRVGSGIKSAYQKLTGGNSKKIEPERFAGFERFTTTPQQQAQFGEDEKLAQSRDKEAGLRHYQQAYYEDAKKVQERVYIPIQKESDIQKAINAYSRFTPNQALISIFDHLRKSISIKEDGVISQQEKQIYRVLLNDIQKEVKQPLTEAEQVNASKDEELLDKLKKSLIIPTTILGKTVLAFSNFIFRNRDEKDEDKSKTPVLASTHNLKQLFTDPLVFHSFKLLEDLVVGRASKGQATNAPKPTDAEKQFFGVGGLQEKKKKLKRVKWIQMI